MRYKINIYIKSKVEERDELLSNFELCQKGQCSCPTDEYKKLQSFNISSLNDELVLNLEAKPNQVLNINEIRKCLEYTSNEFKRNKMNNTTEVRKTHIEIFDPPMCCPSGLCGPDIDPALLDINEVVLKVKKEFDGQVKIERYLLSQQGQKFMQQPEVMKRFQSNGVEILPLTLVDGKVVKEKSYPTYDELKNLVSETA